MEVKNDLDTRDNFNRHWLFFCLGIMPSGGISNA